MTRFSLDMREIIDSSRLSFVATIGAGGAPNVSPRYSLRVFGENSLVFMNFECKRTAENLAHDARIEVSCVDFLRRRGYRFAGQGELRHLDDADLAWCQELLLETNGSELDSYQAVVVTVTEIEPLLSPAYTWGGANESDLVAAWSEIYRLGRPQLGGALTP